MHNREALSIKRLWQAICDYDMWPLYIMYVSAASLHRNFVAHLRNLTVVFSLASQPLPLQHTSRCLSAILASAPLSPTYLPFLLKLGLWSPWQVSPLYPRTSTTVRGYPYRRTFGRFLSWSHCAPCLLRQTHGNFMCVIKLVCCWSVGLQFFSAQGISTGLLMYPYTHPIQVGWCSRNAGAVASRTVSASLYNMWA